MSGWGGQMASSPRLDLVHKAILAGVLGNIEWKDSAIRLMQDDPEMRGFTSHGVRLLLREFVNTGNSLSVRQERRAEWVEDRPDHPYWYRAILPVPEFSQGLLVEAILLDHEEEEDPFIQIVHAHRQL